MATPKSELDQLLEIATDDEADVLEELRLRAGQLVHCDAFDPYLIGCTWVSLPAETVCGGCGSPITPKDTHD
jgi:hypothetical protein